MCYRCSGRLKQSHFDSEVVVFGGLYVDPGNVDIDRREPVDLPELPTEPVPPLYAGRWSMVPSGSSSRPPPQRETAPWGQRLNWPCALRAGSGTFPDSTDPRFSMWSGELLPPPFVPSIELQIRECGSKKSFRKRDLAALWVGGNDVIFGPGRAAARPDPTAISVAECVAR